MSRTRRKTATAFSLFAFQDIITSVTGIIILITLLLAIELMDRTENSPEKKTQQQTVAIEETVEQLEEEKQQLLARITAATSSVKDLPTTDLSTLQMMEDNLNAEIEKLDSQTSMVKANLTESRSTLKKLDAKTRQKLAQQKKELEQISKDNLIAEQKVKDITDNDRMFFREGVKDKTTFLVEVAGNGFLVAQIGVSQAPKRFADHTDFQNWLNALDKSNSAFYLLIKPTGLDNFDASQKTLKASSMDFGYRVIGPNQTSIDPNTGAGK